MSGRSVTIRNGALTVNGTRVPLLSGEVHFFRMDPHAWDAALAGVKALGLPMVSTYLSWRRFSPGHGRHDLEGRTDPRLDVDRFLRLCGKHGLFVTVKPGPWICAEEPNGGYPDWLVEREELHVLDAAGKSVQGYNPPFSSPIPSCLHPAYLAAVRAWLEAVDRKIIEHVYPRGPIILVQLDNEPSMTFHDGLLESDYNPVNTAPGGLYQQWLEAKYGTPTELNRSHGSSWRSFRDVPAPRSWSVARAQDAAPLLDWVEFKEHVLVEHVARIGAMHREYGLDGVIFTINYNEHRQLAVPNDWRALERASGMGGFDYYPRMPLTAEGLGDVALHVAYSRVCNDVPWSPEIMSGTWSFEGQAHAPGAVAARDFAYFYLCCVAFGLKGMNFYMLADRDNWIDSPLDASGSPGPNARAIREVVELICSEPEFERFDRRQPVAVLYYRPHARQAFVAAAAPEARDSAAAALARPYDVFRSLFLELHRLNLDPGIADPWARPERLSQHRVILAPGDAAMDEKTLSILDDYAAHGGTVVWAGPRPSNLSGGHRCLEGGSFDFDGEGGKGRLARVLEENAISPEVTVSAPGVYTVVQRSRGRAWLFVINSNAAPLSIGLGLREAGVTRLRALTAAGSMMVDGHRVELEMDARSVHAWELER